MGDVARAPGPLDSAHRLSAPVITRQSVQTAAHPAIVERGHAETDRVDASADSPVPSGSERTAPAQSSSGAPRSRGPVAKVGGARSRAAPRFCRRGTHVPPGPLSRDHLPAEHGAGSGQAGHRDPRRPLEVRPDVGSSPSPDWRDVHPGWRRSVDQPSEVEKGVNASTTLWLDDTVARGHCGSSTLRLLAHGTARAHRRSA